MDVPTLMICEPGACHDGQWDQMVRLAQAASRAGADVFKVQFWSDPDELAERRRAGERYREVYRRYAVPEAWLGDLEPLCAALRLRLGVTVYLPRDAEVAARHASVLKVAAFEAEAEDLLDALRPFVSNERPLVVSLGMGARKLRHGRFAGKVYQLRCVSAYPAPADALQLSRLWPHCWSCECEGEGALDGLSDHTRPELTWTGALAVAAGAVVVEAHLRLHTTDPENPDAPHAMTPGQFAHYVRNIRFAERCLGEGGDEDWTGPLPCEAEMAAYKVTR